MSRMNYSRPFFRVQGRETVDIHEERKLERLADEYLREHEPRYWPKPKKPKPKKHNRHHRHPFDLVTAVEDDVRDIATDKFFNTPETVQAEVDRRLAWHRETGRL